MWTRKLYVILEISKMKEIYTPLCRCLIHMTNHQESYWPNKSILKPKFNSSNFKKKRKDRSALIEEKLYVKELTDIWSQNVAARNHQSHPLLSLIKTTIFPQNLSVKILAFQQKRWQHKILTLYIDLET